MAKNIQEGQKAQNAGTTYGTSTTYGDLASEEDQVSPTSYDNVPKGVYASSTPNRQPEWISSISSGTVNAKNIITDPAERDKGNIARIVNTH